MGGNKRSLILQDRDRHLLREVSVMRVMDREQAKRVAPFGSTTRANARLLALTHAGFLRRFFLGTVGGARKALYAISPQGAALVSVPYRGPRRSRDQIVTFDFFVAHQLEINELYCLLKYPTALVENVTFLQWASFYEPLAPGIPLIPDGYAEIQTPAKTLAMFVEVDLGNESRNVWQRKVQAYLGYAFSGDFPKRFGHEQFRTLVVAHSDRRLASLRSTTAALTEKIFFFATVAAIRREGFWAPIWQRPTGDLRQPLLPLR